MTELLQIDGLSFTVAGRAILESVDLTLEAGEIHVLLGANGTGKTTLANLVMGCSGYQPTAGTIRFRGRPIDGLPIHERARLGITLTWQEPARFEGLKVRDYLTLGREPGDPAAWLERVGLEPGAYLDRAATWTAWSWCGITPGRGRSPSSTSPIPWRRSPTRRRWGPSTRSSSTP